MKKKLLVITIVLAMLAALSACGPKIPTPTETADTFLTAVKAQDKETLATVYAGGDLDLLEEAAESDESEEANEDSGLTKVYEDQMVPKMLDFDYELSNEKIDGDKATVDVKITTYDIGSAFTAFMADYFTQAITMAFEGASDEEIEKLANTTFESKMSELKEKTYSETVTLNLVNKDDVWKVAEIDDDDEFWNALTGNMIKTLDQLEETYSFDE